MADHTMAVGMLEEGELLDVVHRARRTLGCDEAGLVWVRGASAAPAAHTSELAGALDRGQCDVGEGPSLDAIRQLQAMSVADIGDLTWWPVFRHTAMDVGVKSCLAVPVTVGNDVVGALGFYSRGTNALAGCEKLALDIADQLGKALTGEQAPPRLTVLH